MIAVILAAGRGSRLNNYTNELPKSLLPLNNDKTILDYNLDLLTEIGVEKKIIVTGYESGKIESHIKHLDNIEYVYNPFWDHCNVLGSLYMALPFINETFLFLHADTLVGEKAWQELIKKKGDMILPYQKKKCGVEEMKVKHDSSGTLIEINKTMTPSSADGEFLGIAKFEFNTKKVFQNVAEKLFKSGELNHYMEAVISDSINKNIEIKTFDIGDTPFVEIDFEEDYLKAKEKFKN
ncbi:MAG: phosphocholine cytidylyltransferase family protein [Balneolaceae bacterium]